MLSVAIGTAGLSYASVPLYRMFCQATGFGGTVKTHKGGDEADGYDLPADPATLRNNRLRNRLRNRLHGRRRAGTGAGTAASGGQVVFF